MQSYLRSLLASFLLIGCSALIHAGSDYLVFTRYVWPEHVITALQKLIQVEGQSQDNKNVLEKALDALKSANIQKTDAQLKKMSVKDHNDEHDDEMDKVNNLLLKKIKDEALLLQVCHTANIEQSNRYFAKMDNIRGSSGK